MKPQAPMSSAADGPAPSVPPLPPQLPRPGAQSELPVIRRLQGIALVVALVWMVGGAFAGAHMVSKVMESEFTRQHEKAANQAELIAQLIEKEVHRAEQIALTLSQQAEILELAQQMNSRHQELAAMSPKDREAYVIETGQSQTVDRLFERVQTNVDLLSVFLFDAQGYCIASGYFDPKDGRKLGCWGGNYAQRAYFQQAKRDGKGSQFAVGKRIPEPSLFFARALTENGQFQGAIVVRMDAGKLLEGLHGKPSVTWVTDEQGMTISSTRDELLFRHIGETFYPVPDQQLLRAIYAQTSLATIPLKRDAGSPPAWHMWRLDQDPMVFHQTSVKGRDFHVWHGFDVASSLATYRQSWLFVIAILVSGLLLVLVVERVADFHQRRAVTLERLAALNRSLEGVSNRLYAIATKDHLSQVCTRGFFMQRVDDAVREAKLTQRPLGFLQLDIDFFKCINDSHGHPAGDAAIRHMAELCRAAVGHRDLIGRLGGEEFGICLVDCGLDGALRIAEGLRESVARTPLRFEGATLHFTCSIGVTPLTPEGTCESLLRASDQALYRAKNSGRNCVHLQAGDEITEVGVKRVL